MLAAPATYVEAKLRRSRRKAPLERADHAGGDARGMPVHSHDRAERLKPKRVCKSAQELVASIVKDDRFRYDRAEPAHAIR